MIHKTPSIVPDHVRVVFELPAAIWADKVAVIGDFNEWSPDATPLHQGWDAKWRAVVELSADVSHAFCYLVDGRPMLEYPADGFETRPDGTVYSLVAACLSTDVASPRSSMTETCKHEASLLQL